MIPMDCNGCQYCSPKEEEQSEVIEGIKEPHICKLSGERLYHRGHHPHLPTPYNCPLIKIASEV